MTQEFFLRHVFTAIKRLGPGLKLAIEFLQLLLARFLFAFEQAQGFADHFAGRCVASLSSAPVITG
jgi:hypothetical protein